MYSPWRKLILNKVSTNLHSTTAHPGINPFNKQENMVYMEELHNHFIIVPLDKAPKNIGIICKYFYLQMLNDEIIKSGDFTQSNYTVPDIVSKYSSILKEKHNISFKQSNLPFLYWISKFHKYPVDFRFITSGKNTVINTLSKFIGICLKHLLDVEGHHSKLLHKFDGIKDYYIIDNNKEVIQFMKESNSLNNYDKTSKHMILKHYIPKYLITN